jgi:uncharacterized protein (TIGR02722 family)
MVSMNMTESLFTPRRYLRAGLAFTTLALVLIGGVGCGPKAVRGGPGTDNPDLDRAAMSTTLDRDDVSYLVNENLNAMFASPFWARDVQAAESPPVLAIWPIKNATSEHLDEQMLQLLSSIETTFVNSGAVNVVSRERQAEMAAEVGVQNTDTFDPATAAKLGRQIGAKYYVTGKLTSVDERSSGGRRMQYALFLQVIEVETSMIKFQKESIRSKAIVR